MATTKQTNKINNTKPKKLKLILPPFFSRIGGKFRLRKQITPLIPVHKTYVELFIGAGSILLHKGKACSIKEVINDLDKDIYDIWKDFKKAPELVKNMDFTNNKKKFNKLLTKQYKSTKKRLFRNLYLSFNSFGANRTHYAKSRNIKATLLKKRIDDYKERLKDVKVYNKDFREVIKKYDNEDTFFYLDPPYDDSSGNYTHETLKIEDVYEAVKNIKGKFLLSYSYQEKLDTLFKDFNIKKIQTKYQRNNKNNGLNSKKVRYEVLISNYKLE